MIDELSIHKNEQYAIGFLICGKTSSDSKYKANELFWMTNNGKVDFKIIRHGYFIRTGDAKQYLDGHFIQNPNLNTDRYWKNMNLNKIESELKDLFMVAVREKNKLNGDKFSENYDTEIITDN